MTDAHMMQAIREIATNLQANDARRAHAQMEILAIFLEVSVSTLYGVTEEVAKEASAAGVVARDYLLDPVALKYRLAAVEGALSTGRRAVHA